MGRGGGGKWEGERRKREERCRADDDREREERERGNLITRKVSCEDDEVRTEGKGRAGSHLTLQFHDAWWGRGKGEGGGVY